MEAQKVASLEAEMLDKHVPSAHPLAEPSSHDNNPHLIQLDPKTTS